MQVAIRPVDIWLFRDGKPFTAGEDHIAESAFPPSPLTLQGAIRTKVLADKGVDFLVFAQSKRPDPDVGYGDIFGKLRLCGPLLMWRRENEWERLIPLPADIIRVGEDYELLRPECDLPFFSTNMPSDLRLLWVRTKEHPGEGKGWLPESQWKRYLQGQAPERAQVVSSDQLFTFEPRFGIAIDHEKGTAQEAMLYQARFVRLQDQTALWAKVNGVQIKESGLLRFGGEGRAAVYEKLQKELPPLSKFYPGGEVKRFKIVLITPAWFSGGWQPQDGNWSKIFNASVRLVGVVLPRPLHLGGFDVARGVPKPMRAFVPPGAVYFFEAESHVQFIDDFAFTETPEPIREQNNGVNAWAQIGLGATLIGAW